jgi:hypothetical protein
MPEAGRQSGQIILDAVSVFRADEGSNAAMDLALQRLSDVEAVTVSEADEEGVTLDISPLVGGAMVTVQWLVESLANHRGVDRSTVIAEVRQFLDA